MKEFCSREWSLSLAGELHRRLSPRRTFVEAWRTSSRQRVWCVSGEWALHAHGERGETVVRMTFGVADNWMNEPPRATTDAGFIRHEADWHVNPDASLCHVLREEWEARIDHQTREAAFDMNVIVDFAASWCLAAADSLVTRHLIGRRVGMTKWPHEWDDWSHGQIGVAEFEREYRKERRAA